MSRDYASQQGGYPNPGNPSTAGQAGPTPAHDLIAHLGEEVVHLEKMVEDLRNRLAFFLEPEIPSVSSEQSTSKSMGGGSELTSRLGELTRRVIAIREDIIRLAHRVV